MTHWKTNWKILTFAVITLSLSCNAANQAKTNSLRPGILLNERTADEKKAQALIYYANNPVETNSYVHERKIILNNYGQAAKLAPNLASGISNAQESFGTDLTEFNEAVARDISLISTGICSTAARINAGAVILTNTGIIQNNLVYCAPHTSPQPIPAAIAAKLLNIYNSIKIHPIYEHSPLSHPDMMRAALDVATNLFPATTFEYSLIVKSHGSAQMLVTPKIAYTSKIVTPNFIAGYFSRHKGNATIAKEISLDKGDLNKDGLDKGDLNKDGLDKGDLNKGGLDGEDPQPINSSQTVGISKLEMLRILTVEHSSMYFNVLFFESCKSDLGTLLQDLAEYDGSVNVGYLFVSDEKGLSYNTINWNQANDSTTPSLRKWLVDHLNSIAAKATKK